jgi:MEMO1 family protein
MNNSPGGLDAIVRPPAVAGYFYPGAPEELQYMVSRLLDQAEATGPVPKALIAPHAGYIYSGPTAAIAYASLRARARDITRVILLGPAHRVYIRGLALSRATHFATPLGKITVDQEAIKMLGKLKQVNISDAAHEQEHSLEVHLPFLQILLEDFQIVPLVAGEANPAEVAEVLELLWGGEETLIIISSDLSHYHNYETARLLDQSTTMSIEKLQLEQIGSQQACGCIPVQGLLHVARSRQMKVRTLDLRNSGDTAGSRDRVVGYGAYAFTQA